MIPIDVIYWSDAIHRELGFKVRCVELASPERLPPAAGEKAKADFLGGDFLVNSGGQEYGVKCHDFHRTYKRIEKRSTY